MARRTATDRVGHGAVWNRAQVTRATMHGVEGVDPSIRRRPRRLRGSLPNRLVDEPQQRNPAMARHAEQRGVRRPQLVHFAVLGRIDHLDSKRLQRIDLDPRLRWDGLSRRSRTSAPPSRETTYAEAP